MSLTNINSGKLQQMDTYEFYSKGDKDFREQEITQDDTIVKSDTLAFTPSDTFTKLLLAQSAGLTAIAV